MQYVLVLMTLTGLQGSSVVGGSVVIVVGVVAVTSGSTQLSPSFSNSFTFSVNE